MGFLTQEQKKDFVENGFIILNNIIPRGMIDAAIVHCDAAYEGKIDTKTGLPHPNPVKCPRPCFYPRVMRQPPIADLYLETPLQEVVQDILGEGKAKLTGKQGQIAYRPKNKNFDDLKLELTDPHPKQGWHIDAPGGKYATFGIPFCLIIGIILSEGQDVDENRGQFVIWPGSHLITHDKIQELAKTVPLTDLHGSFVRQKPRVGPPKRTMLRPGDVIVGHQRLAHSPGINMVDTIRKNIYLRIHHTDADSMLEQFMRSPTPWIGFYGLQEVLPPGTTDPSTVPIDDETCPDETASETTLQRNRRLLTARGISDELPEDIVGKLHLHEEQKQNFIRDGYLVIRDVIPQKRIDAANKHLDNVLAQRQNGWANMKKVRGSDKPPIIFARWLVRALPYKSLMFKTGLVDLAEEFLGEQNVVVQGNFPDVTVQTTAELFLEEGRPADEEHPAGGWTGSLGKGLRYGNKGCDHLFRIGIVLSDGMDVDENRGQPVVWPGSHYITHPVFSKLAGEVKEKGMKVFWRSKKNLDVGRPKRLLLKPGDVYVVHHRLATARAANMQEDAKRTAEFYIEHVNFENLIPDILADEEPFVGFDGLLGEI